MTSTEGMLGNGAWLSRLAVGILEKLARAAWERVDSTEMVPRLPSLSVVQCQEVSAGDEGINWSRRWLWAMVDSGWNSSASSFQ